jgi:uncharacterized membrane protein YeaQ/YmgE (transglycosylase-associated protein family)
MGGIIGFLSIICVGAVIGWLTSLIVNGTGSGLLMDILAGVIGSIIANYGASLLGLSFGVLGSLLAAVGCAVIVLMLIKFIRKT